MSGYYSIVCARTVKISAIYYYNQFSASQSTLTATAIATNATGIGIIIPIAIATLLSHHCEHIYQGLLLLSRRHKRFYYETSQEPQRC